MKAYWYNDIVIDTNTKKVYLGDKYIPETLAHNILAMYRRLDILEYIESMRDRFPEEPTDIELWSCACAAEREFNRQVSLTLRTEESFLSEDKARDLQIDVTRKILIERYNNKEEAND